MLKDWFSMPCKATLSVKLGDQPLSEGTLGERLPGAWDERGIEVTGLIASNLSDLNLGRPINPGETERRRATPQHSPRTTARGTSLLPGPTRVIAAGPPAHRSTATSPLSVGRPSAG